MNIINATPQAYGEIITTSRKNTPAFKGAPKAPTASQAKEAGSFIKGLYQMFFVPGKEQISKMTGGNVYTTQTSKHGSKLYFKKYNLWSRKPVEIVEDNRVTSLRRRTVFNKDGSYDYEVRDMHTPEYKVSVKYNNLTDSNKSSLEDGPVKINYGDKEITLSPEKRKAVLNDMESALSEKFNERINNLLNHTEDYKTLRDEFYQDPDVIGVAILSSKGNLEKQLETVPASLAYGIENILGKCGK